MKYLITGGAGFIGSHLVEAILNKGDEVIILDNISTGSLSNLDSKKAQVNLVVGSILDKEITKKVINECDEVVHLAAALGVMNIVNKPLESLKTNIQGTENILEFADKFNKPVLLASTSEIYGKNNKVPLNEEDDRILGHPLKSRWTYSEAKAIDESMAYFYWLNNNLPIRIVRLFNTVGPRQVGEYGMVAPRFVRAALRNEPITVFGTGNQIRCFCHVYDVIRALLLVLNSTKSIGSVFNIGNNQQISILDFAKKVIELTDSRSEIINIPYSQVYPNGFEDMERRVPDISKIKNILGWSPEINLDQIIKDIADFNSK